MEIVVEGIKLQRQQELRLPGKVLSVFLLKKKGGGDESFADSHLIVIFLSLVVTCLCVANEEEQENML